MHVMTFTPIGKVVVSRGVVQVTEADPLASTAVGNDQATTPVATLRVESALMFAGHVMLGGVVSDTTIRNEQLAVLPAVSLAEQLTRLEPFKNDEPAAGEQVTDCTPTLSAAKGLS